MISLPQNTVNIFHKIYMFKKSFSFINCYWANLLKELVLMLDNTALVIVIIGALNWLCIGLFGFDLVASLFGGQGALISRIIYTIVGIAGIWSITLLFKDKTPAKN